MLVGVVPLSRFELARYLRRTMSGDEWDLWSHLRANQVDGFKFRRKALLGPYIVDFVCLSARVVVEIGGEMYDRSPTADAARAAWLEAQGFRVVRVAPHDVRERIELVVTTIAAELAETPTFSAASGPGFFRGRRARLHRRGEQDL
jgi:very-short-patch-repair endonuclease